MASLIKTNKISTPGGEDFTLPTTYPASTVALESTSTGVLQYGNANPTADRMSTNAGLTGEVFCDKIRIQNNVNTSSNVVLNALPTGLTDADQIVMTRLEFFGVCFNQDAYPFIQLLDASDNPIIETNQSMSRKHWYGSNNGQQWANYQTNNSASSNGMPLYQTYGPCGSANIGTNEVFSLNFGESGLAFMNGEVWIQNITAAAQANNSYNTTRIWAQFCYRIDQSNNTNSNYWGMQVADYSTSNTYNPYTKVKFYDQGGGTMTEGLWITQSFINPNKT